MTIKEMGRTKIMQETKRQIVRTIKKKQVGEMERFKFFYSKLILTNIPQTQVKAVESDDACLLLPENLGDVHVEHLQRIT